MKKLVVYYSYKDSTEFLAKSLANEINADLLSLQLVHEKKSKGFIKFVWGGYQAMMKKKPKLHPYEIDVHEYEEIIIATPVWAGTYVPPIRTFIEEENIVAKRIAYFFTRSSGTNNVEALLDEVLSDNHLLGSLDLITHKTTKEENNEKLINWAKSLEL